MRAPGGSLSAVHKVLNRALWTGVVAVLVVAFLGAGLMLGPLQEMARAGDVVAGQATFNRGDFHGFVGQPLVRPGQMPPAVVSIPAIVHRPFGTEPARLRHRIFGLGLPAAGVGLSYGPFDDVGAINPPAGAGAADDGYPDGGDRISANRGGCRSETRMVSSEDGGERPIKITWCRKG